MNIFLQFVPRFLKKNNCQYKCIGSGNGYGIVFYLLSFVQVLVESR